MIQTTCVRGRTAAAALLVLALSVCAVAALQDSVVYTEAQRARQPSAIAGHPYADLPHLCRPAAKRHEARALIDELGMLEHLDEYKARALVVGPDNCKAYGPTNHLEAFQDLLAPAVHRTSK